MNSLIITPASEAERQLLTAFLASSKIAAKTLSEEELEDFGLGILMQEAKDSSGVSRASVMRQLGRA